jgi:hypothetical protein
MVCLALTSPSLGGEDSDDLKRRFLTDAPVQWARYRQWTATLQGTIIERWQRAGWPDQSQELHIRCNGACALVRRLSRDTDKSDMVLGRNSHYEFSLIRNFFNDSWMVNGAPLEGVPLRDCFFAGAMPGMLDQRSILVRLDNLNLARLVTLPGFRVLRADSVDRPGARLVRIDFDVQSHPAMLTRRVTPEPARTRIRGGTLQLDPDRCWCLRSADLRTSEVNAANNVRQFFEFTDTWGHYPLPRRVTTDEETETGTGTRQTIHQLVDFDLSAPWWAPDETEFTLSAYGFEEPPGAPPPGISRNRLQAAAAGAIAVATILAIRRLRGRWIRRHKETVRKDLLPHSM